MTYTYGPKVALAQLRPGAVFQDEHGDRYVRCRGPNNDGWLSVLDLSDGRSGLMHQEFVVREIILTPVSTLLQSGGDNLTPET